MQVKCPDGYMPTRQSKTTEHAPPLDAFTTNKTKTKIHLCVSSLNLSRWYSGLWGGGGELAGYRGGVELVVGVGGGVG